MPNIDEIIRKAMEEGAFDNLAGQGKPLDLSENPHVDPSWQMAYHLLKENGFLPAFIEQRQAIETELAAARAALVRTWVWRQQAEAGEDAYAEWKTARQRFEASVVELNAKILNYNLSVPNEKLARLLIDSEAEIAQLTGGEG
jgi:DnaJ family protein C protein 28